MINSIFCFIPAKINSSRLKQKNIKFLHGKPMINYCIDAVKKTNLFAEHIYVSTDSNKIKTIVKNQGVKVPQLRPKKLGKDPYGVSDTLIDFINRNPFLLDFSHVAIVLPTSPLIDKDDILNAYYLFESREFKSIMSVCETDYNARRSIKIENDLIVPLFNNDIKKQSQLLEPTYRINGAIMILEIKTFLKHKSYFTPEIGAFIMPKERSVDVDSIDDFNYASYLLDSQKKEYKSSYKCLKQSHFKNQNFSLIPIRFEDRISIMKWRNEQLYHLRQKSPLTIADQDSYFEQTVSKLFHQSNPNQILFSFLKNQELIGYGGLVHIDWDDRRAEISFVMNTSLEKKFFSLYWTAFLKMIEHVAYKELGFFKVFVYAFDLRPHLYQVLEENEYFEDARLKKHIYHENTFHDVLIYSKFNMEK